MSEVDKMKTQQTFADQVQDSVQRWPAMAASVLKFPVDFEETRADALPLDGILPKEEFLERLRFEKRRVDRSKGPLSMALLELNEDSIQDARKQRELLVYLKSKTRETDIKGWVNRRILGLLLLDTDGPGARCCVKLLENGRSGSISEIYSGTYPDQLFQEILDQTGTEPQIFSLDIQEQVIHLSLQATLKRLMDFVGALAGLILFSPLMLITALAIKMTSPGPVIFKQSRLGKRGNQFTFYKFRSMVSGNDDRVHQDYVAKLINGEKDQLDQGNRGRALYKLKNDCRITRVGRVIRKLSIDEIPQLYNVLKGEMSLVGPRPPIPYEVEKYKSWHLRRILEVKPGITGLWQVEGRSKTSFDDMVRLDIRYLQGWSIWLDLKILVRTVREVLFPQGGF
jgi:lipopolysaccharide/colanic/teichoic acid biosynthesis glycosyltransferase